MGSQPFLWPSLQIYCYCRSPEARITNVCELRQPYILHTTNIFIPQHSNVYSRMDSTKAFAERCSKYIHIYCVLSWPSSKEEDLLHLAPTIILKDFKNKIVQAGFYHPPG